MNKKLTAIIATMSLSAALVGSASASGTGGDMPTGGGPLRGNTVNNTIDRMTNNLDRDLSTNGYSGNGYRMNYPDNRMSPNPLNNFSTTPNSTTGNTMRGNSVNNGTGTGTGTNRTMSRDYYNNTGTGTGTGNYRTNSVRAQSTTTNRGSNWGWLGLLGLFGLAGMRRRESDRA